MGERRLRIKLYDMWTIGGFFFICLILISVFVLPVFVKEDMARIFTILGIVGLFSLTLGFSLVGYLLDYVQKKKNAHQHACMHGVGYHRFRESVEEVFLKIRRELRSAGIIN